MRSFSINYYGIFTAGTVTVAGEPRHAFVHVTTPVAGTPGFS